MVLKPFFRYSDEKLVMTGVLLACALFLTGLEFVPLFGTLRLPLQYATSYAVALMTLAPPLLLYFHAVFYLTILLTIIVSVLTVGYAYVLSCLLALVQKKWLRYGLLAIPCVVVVLFFIISLPCTPQVVMHEQPGADLHMENDVFLSIGCTIDDQQISCPSLSKLGCSALSLSPDGYAGLETPMLVCTPNRGTASPDALVGEGCMARRQRSIIAYADGIVVMNTTTEVKAFFAPITRPEQALSYAALVTDSYPLYSLEKRAGYKYIVRQVDLSYVNATSSGFIVHLFRDDHCGCGPKGRAAVDYLVSDEGKITLLNQQVIEEDLSLRRACVD
ncbi:MAG: hypothetical protein V1725_04390 [archaeon]